MDLRSNQQSVGDWIPGKIRLDPAAGKSLRLHLGLDHARFDRDEKGNLVLVVGPDYPVIVDEVSGERP